MAKTVIPYESSNLDLSVESRDFHAQSITKNRNAMLSELRCLSGIPEIVSSLNQDTLYKLVLTPDGGKLFKDTAGNIKGVFYKEGGGILEHAKFQTISPSLIKAASAVGSQILLISIAMQLNRIEKGMSRIFNELHNDRISEISSGVNQFKQAMMVQDKERQSRIIENAIQTLNTGIEKTVRSLKEQIKEAPNTKRGFFDNWTKDESKAAEKEFACAEESFKECLLGIKTLSECYAAINEPNAASATLIANLSNLKASGIEIAADKARLLPAKGNNFPEAPWVSFLENESLFIKQMDECQSLSTNGFKSIEIEFKPRELMGLKHETV